MSNYEKYLKYKNKYLTLKKQLDEQEGGYSYEAGYYVFFHHNSYDINDIMKKYEGKSFDDFTNKLLDDCAMYFRIKDNTWTNYKFDTVYPNSSTLTLVKNIFNNVTSMVQKAVTSTAKKGGALCPGNAFQSKFLGAGLNLDQVNLDIVQNIAKEIKEKNPKILEISSIYLVENQGNTSIIQAWNIDNYGNFKQIYKKS